MTMIKQIFSFLLLELLWISPSFCQQLESKVNLKYSEKYCAPIWQDHIYGECMGRNNSLIAYDYDSDGIDELIVNANTNVQKNGFWYILKYMPLTKSYEKVFVSPLFEKQIEKMAISTNGKYTRLCIASAGSLYIYNIETLTLEQEIFFGKSPWILNINDLNFRDINNDNIDEIIVNGKSWLKILDGASYDIITDIEGVFWRFDIGNVDDDTNLELVSTTGTVYDLSPQGNIHTEYHLELPSWNSVDIVLEDIDNDGKEEGIFGDKYSGIGIFDIENESLKYEITLFSGVNTMNLMDIGGSSLRELVVSSFSKGILFYDLITGKLIKSFDSEIYVIPSIAISDFDNDGVEELVHGTACSSSSDDILYFLSIENGNQEYQNVFTEGNFFGIEIEDIDNDGRKELISMSAKNEYNSGTLSIYDAVSKELKFRSKKGFLPKSISEAKFIEVIDYGQDGDLDIVIGGGEYSQGEICVIDGSTYTMELDYLFAPNIDGIDAMQKYETFNGTENLIIIAGSKLYSISGSNFDINWEVEIPNMSSFNKSQLLIHDLSNDGEKEIIVTYNRIYKFSLGGKLKLQSDYNLYTVSQIVQWGMNGAPILFSGTKFGDIVMLDDSLNIINKYKITDSDINNIIGADLNLDGRNELIIGTENNIIFLSSEGRMFINPIGKKIGKFDGFKYLDYNNDGKKELIAGSLSNVMEIDLTCIECLFVQNKIFATNPKCDYGDGSIEIFDSTLYSNITLNGKKINGFVDSLKQGNYELVLTDLKGCVHSYSVDLFDETLNISGKKKNVSCPGYADGEFYINVVSGEPEYIFTLSNNIVDDTIKNLSGGVYTICGVDGNNCVDTFTFYILERLPYPFEIRFHSDDLATEELEGYISIIASNYSYLWEDGSTKSYLDSLKNGSYSVLLKDIKGCEIDTTITLGSVNSSNNIIENEINIYPIPAKDIVNINVKNGSINEIIMFSIQGEIIKLPPHIKLSESIFQLNVSHITSGMYLLSIKKDIKTYYKKLIIQ